MTFTKEQSAEAAVKIDVAKSDVAKRDADKSIETATAVERERVVEATKVEAVASEEQKPECVQKSPPSAASTSASATKPKSRRLSSGFSLKAELSQTDNSSEVEQSEGAGGAARKFDPETEHKLIDAREAIVTFVSSTRPRFKPFFEAMKISSEAIELTVPTAELEVELRRAEIEMMAKIVEMAKVNGYLELRIVVNEEETKSMRPIKLEDRVAHFSKLNPLIAELTKALDLQVDS